MTKNNVKTNETFITLSEDYIDRDNENRSYTTITVVKDVITKKCYMILSRNHTERGGLAVIEIPER